MKEIKLTQGQVAIVDDWRFDELCQYKWYAKWDSKTQSFRAMHAFRLESGEQKVVFMHSYIMRTPSGMVTDHINQNTLDNQESNLRACTDGQNKMNRSKQANNTSGYKGVARNGSGWRVQIQVDGKKMCFGTYKSPEDAAKVYDKEVIKVHGEFASLNFPSTGGK